MKWKKETAAGGDYTLHQWSRQFQCDEAKSAKVVLTKFDDEGFTVEARILLPDSKKKLAELLVGDLCQTIDRFSLGFELDLKQ